VPNHGSPHALRNTANRVTVILLYHVSDDSIVGNLFIGKEALNLSPYIEATWGGVDLT